MVNQEQKIRKRDDNLLKKEMSWRRARIGAIFISIIHVLVLVVLLVHQRSEFSSLEEQKEHFVAIGLTLFWFLVVSELNLRLGHIESIKLYRKKESEAVKE
jgi:hypothetical protein